jgi:hypothetical protein
MSHHTTAVGTHNELLAAAALMAAGYEVLKPLAPEIYDLATRHPVTGETKYYQVKTAIERPDRNAIVVHAKNGKKGIYPKSKIDYIIGVHGEDVYVFENRELKEYWATPENIGDKWIKLKGNIKNAHFRGGFKYENKTQRPQK